jgi:hypothetical protein
VSTREPLVMPRETDVPIGESETGRQALGVEERQALDVDRYTERRTPPSSG